MQLNEKLSAAWFMCLGFILSVLISSRAFADNDNPFPSINVTDGNVIKASGTYIELALKYGTLGVGGLLILISLGVLILRMREDSREKEHGNLIMTFVFIGLGCTLGFLLIAIGWKAFNVQIQT